MAKKVKRTSKKKVARKKAPRKTARPKKKPVKKAAPNYGTEIGRVTAFFRIPVVAVVKVKKGRLRVGERIHIKGHTTDLRMTVASMQINPQPVPEAKPGDEGGIQVPSRARRGDRVYLPPHNSCGTSLAQGHP